MLQLCIIFCYTNMLIVITKIFCYNGFKIICLSRKKRYSFDKVMIFDEGEPQGLH